MTGITQMIEVYGMGFEPSEDMNFVEAMDIIADSQTKMEIAGNSYLYGFMRGSRNMDRKKMVLLCNIRQMTDARWNELAAVNKKEREMAAV